MDGGFSPAAGGASRGTPDASRDAACPWVGFGPRCRAVGQHSAVAERLSRGAGHGGRTLLQRLIEAAFFLVRVPFNAHIQCPKELHIHNLEEHSPAEGFHYVNKHSDFLGTSSDKKK